MSDIQNQEPQQQRVYNARVLKTDRSWILALILSIVTCGIYGIIFWYKMVEDINEVASRRDGKKTMNYIVALLLSPITCGIYAFIWQHGFSQRVGDEARARGFDTNFGASTFWLWNILGSLIIVGPFVYLHKLCAAMNYLCEDYNRNGI